MTTKLWGGRFAEKTSSEVDAFNASIGFDYKLWPYDIEGSLAHVRMLGRQKIISSADAKKIEKGLKEIATDIAKGNFEWRVDQEDVHLNIEAELIRRIGPAGGKLHTARSRNDQSALDVRLYGRDQIRKLKKALRELQTTLLTQAEKNIDIILPGYTHLQRAQPILLSHHLLAYFEMAARDLERLQDLLKRMETLPLGAGALAGTPFPIDRASVAKELGFGRVAPNSLDAVGSRDHLLELLSCCAMIMTHLSRFADEMILWSSFEFGFVKLPENFCTGSSMMPQKMNPDVPELIRGKTGRVLGHLMGLFTTVKGLPLAYNKDLQEDKEPLFDTIETTLTCLTLTAHMLAGTQFRADRMLQATRDGFLVATDLADYLVNKGIPFRESHHIVGQIVRAAQERAQALDEISLTELRRFSDKIEEDVAPWLSVTESVNRRTSYGGTAKSEVKKQLKRARLSLKK